MNEVRTVHFPSLVRLSWRLRLRRWWRRRRLSEAVLALEEEVTRREDEAFLFGRRDPLAGAPDWFRAFAGEQ